MQVNVDIRLHLPQHPPHYDPIAHFTQHQFPVLRPQFCISL